MTIFKTIQINELKRKEEDKKSKSYQINSIKINLDIKMP